MKVSDSEPLVVDKSQLECLLWLSSLLNSLQLVVYEADARYPVYMTNHQKASETKHLESSSQKICQIGRIAKNILSKGIVYLQTATSKPPK